MPILGVLASAITGNLSTTTYQSIATTTVGGGGSSTITFSSIPATYKHLQLRMILRSDRANTFDDIKVQLNSDTGNNYADHILTGDGSSTSAYGESSFSMIYSYVGQPAASVAANIIYAGIMDILDYSSTVKNKTTRWLAGQDLNGSGYVGLSSGLWANTSAISTITFSPRYGTNFVQYSQIALYGIKGA